MLLHEAQPAEGEGGSGRPTQSNFGADFPRVRHTQQQLSRVGASWAPHFPLLPPCPQVDAFAPYWPGKL